MEAPKGKSTHLEENWEESRLSPSTFCLSDEIRDNPELWADNAFPVPQNQLPLLNSPCWNFNKTHGASLSKSKWFFWEEPVWELGVYHGMARMGIPPGSAQSPPSSQKELYPSRC